MDGALLNWKLLQASALNPLTRLLDGAQQTYFGTYIGAALVVALFYAWSQQGKKPRRHGMLRYMFPKKLWLHRSTALDLKLYLFGSMYVVLQSALLLGSLMLSHQYLLTLLRTHLGTMPFTVPPIVGLVVMPIVLFLAYELGYWLAHYLMHRVPFLWDYHKLHHNAEVLTPLTEWRQHPVEYFLFPIVYGAVVAIAYAITAWLLGEVTQFYHYWNYQILFMPFLFTLVHLRHSHLRMSAPGILKYLIQTPAHHQIHHSVERRHFDKNLGYCLVFWDWVFGTLYLPEKNQKLRYGIAGDMSDHHFAKELARPFVSSARRIRHVLLRTPDSTGNTRYARITMDE